MQIPHAAPALDTQRLSLRAHGVADFDDSAALWGDPVVTRFIGGRPFTREEVWARLLRYVGHWQLLGFGFWAVRETATGRFLGEVGFAEGKRPIVPSIEGTPEIGWALAPWGHGQGFATEAVQAVVAWGDERFEGARTTCMIAPENAASMRVAERCGYRRFTDAVYHDAPTVLFERPAR